MVEEGEGAVSGKATMTVEVAYATPSKQKIVVLRVAPGCTVYEAAKMSGIDELFSNLDLEVSPMGVFGKAERNPKQRVLKAGDRVEIYRPLIADPKEARKRRAEKAKALKAKLDASE